LLLFRNVQELRVRTPQLVSNCLFSMMERRKTVLFVGFPVSLAFERFPVSLEKRIPLFRHPPVFFPKSPCISLKEHSKKAKTKLSSRFPLFLLRKTRQKVAFSPPYLRKTRRKKFWTANSSCFVFLLWKRREQAKRREKKCRPRRESWRQGRGLSRKNRSANPLKSKIGQGPARSPSKNQAQFALAARYFSFFAGSH